MNNYIPVNKVGLILQVGGMRKEKIYETIQANNRLILAEGDKRYVNEQGNDNVDSMQVKNTLVIQDLDVYQEITTVKSEIKSMVKRYNVDRLEVYRKIRKEMKSMKDELVIELTNLKTSVGNELKTLDIKKDLENLKKEIESRVEKKRKRTSTSEKGKIGFNENYN